MKPISLALCNICQHRKVNFNYLPGVTGIVGRNGSGKSNLVHIAQYFAFTGKTPGDRVKQELVLRHENVGKTELVFEHDKKTFTLSRSIPSGTTRLTSADGTVDLRGAEVGLQMEAFLGISLDIFYEVCWVPQGSMVEVLEMSHAQRLTFFQKLMDLRQAETLRGVLQDTLTSLPTYIDQQSTIDNERQAIVEVGEVITQLTAQKKEFDDLLKDFKAQEEDAQYILSLPSENKHIQQLKQQQQIITQIQLCLEKQNKYKPVVGVPKELPGAENRNVWEQRKRLLAEITELEEILAGLKYPQESTFPLSKKPTAIQLEIEKAEEQHRELVLLLLMATSNTCPTCKRPFTAAECKHLSVNELTTKKNQLSTLITELKKDLTTQTMAATKYDLDMAVVESRKVEATTRAAKLKQQLAIIPDIVWDENKYQQQITEYKQYVDASRKLIEWNQTGRELEQNKAMAEGVLQQLKVQKFATEDQIAAANEFKAKLSELIQKVHSIEVQIAQQEANSAMLQRNLHEHEQLQCKRAAIQHKRIIIERCRDVLHRDNLPRVVLQKLLHGLNVLLDKYLNSFQVPYLAHINNDFEFLCTFNNQDELPARLLSGGEKVALAMAFRLALADLLAGSIPLLVLDEPTIWLDEVNIRRMCQVLLEIRSLAEKGTYVQVATHDSELLPAFSRVVRVGA